MDAKEARLGSLEAQAGEMSQFYSKIRGAIKQGLFEAKVNYKLTTAQVRLLEVLGYVVSTASPGYLIEW